MSNNLYRWTYHFDGVKKVCELKSERKCVGPIATLPSIVEAILDCEKNLAAQAQARGGCCEAPNAEDIYPVSMQFMMSTESADYKLSDSLEEGDEKEWFKNNLHKVVAAYGIDQEESSTYLVVGE